MSANQEADEQKPAKKSPIGAGRATGIMVASGISAVASLLITITSARALSIEENKEFLVFWATLFGIYGIISGTQTESTRAVSAGRAMEERGEDKSGRASVLGTALILGVIVAVLIFATSWLWAPRLVPMSAGVVTAVVTIGVFLYAGEMSLSGSFAGAKEWNYYSALMAGEAGLRFILILIVALVAPSLVGFEIAAGIPAGLWLLFLLTDTGRRVARSRADVGAKQLIKNTLQAMLSSAAWACLVTSFATMLELTSPNEDPALLAVTILAVTLTRSPIMMPLQAFQGVLISWISESPDGKVRPVLKIMAAVAGIGLVLSICAAWLGPWLMRLLFGPEYIISWWVLGALTLAAVSMAWLVLTGATAVAISEHRAYATGWVVAAVSAFIILSVLPYNVQIRAIIALWIAPLIGVAIHLGAIAKHEKTATASKNRNN